MSLIDLTLCFYIMLLLKVPSGESLGGESGEDDVVEGADADAGEHGGDGERGHGPDHQGRGM